ncbi:MAG: hypothetical protein M1336_00470 [Deltaproteobacteria bacterium]|jgi:aspartate-semialdehyde dehydrogenase|nr:hypothetical protein [Deltaproteobacteria bacterium]
MTADLSRKPALAVVGATGAVGSQIVELVKERQVLAGGLKLYSRPAANDGRVEAGELSLPVEVLDDWSALNRADAVFLAVAEAPAREILAAVRGPLLIDLSAATRKPGERPLVAPGLTPRQTLVARAASGERVFEVPHPAAQLIAGALKALAVPPGMVGATLLLGASFGGRARMDRLFEESANLLSGRAEADRVAQGYAFNAVSGPAEQELAAAIAAQAAGLGVQDHQLALRTALVPLLHGAALALHLAEAPDADQWPARLGVAPGFALAQSGAGLSALDAVGCQAALCSLDRQSGATTLWAVFDGARLAALSAVWIAENLLPAEPGPAPSG